MQDSNDGVADVFPGESGAGNESMGRQVRARSTLAVDIDNVVACAERRVQDLYYEVTGLKWPRARYASAGGLDADDLDPAVVEAIFERFHECAIPGLPLMPAARLAIERLRTRYRVVFVTSRRPSSRLQTMQWIDRQRIPYDALYHAEVKTEIPETITAAVDDHPDHAVRYAAAGIRVFLMDHGWNRGITHPLMTRVTGWDALLHALHVGSSSSQSIPLQETASPARLVRRLSRNEATPDLD